MGSQVPRSSRRTRCTVVWAFTGIEHETPRACSPAPRRIHVRRDRFPHLIIVGRQATRVKPAPAAIPNQLRLSARTRVRNYSQWQCGSRWRGTLCGVTRFTSANDFHRLSRCRPSASCAKVWKCYKSHSRRDMAIAHGAEVGPPASPNGIEERPPTARAGQAIAKA